MYADDRERIVASVKDSVEEAGSKSEYSAYYFIIGLSVAIFVGIILVIANIKTKENQVAAYQQKIKEDVTNRINEISSTQNQSKYLDSQITALQVALSKRIDFASFLGELGQKQYKDARWTAFNLSSSTVKIKMEADHIEDTAKAVSAFQAARGIREAKLSQVQVNPDNGRVSFVIDLTVDFSQYKIAAGAK